MSLLTVTLVKIAPDGTETEYPSITALRRETTGDPHATAAYLQPDITRIHIKASTLPDGVRPDRQDRIVDDVNEETWVIERVSWDTLRTRHKCYCQLLINP